MEISKIKTMTKTLEKMETMRAFVEENINKDIDEKRKEAFKAIGNYMDEIANALDGTKIKFELTSPAAYKVFSDKCDNYFIEVGFNAKYRISDHGYEMSKNPSKWWIASVNNGRYSTRRGYRNEKHSRYDRFIDKDIPLIECDYAEGDNRYAKGVINFIETWSELKPEIEERVEKALKEKMDTACKATENRITSYKIVEEFEV